MEQDFHSSLGRFLGLCAVSLSGSECGKHSHGKTFKDLDVSDLKKFNMSEFKHSLLFFKVVKKCFSPFFKGQVA